MVFIKKYTSVIILLFALQAFAIMPVKIAKIDRKLWPYKMDSSTSFDIASKCEMLVFVEALNEIDALSENILIENLGVKHFDPKSVLTWKKETQKRIENNIKNLSDNSLKDLIEIQKNSSWAMLSLIKLEKKMPENLKKWYIASKVFYKEYLIEQLRLAAMSPRISSEIFKISNQEITGDEFSQKKFLLTFDDGPTQSNGHTDKLLEILSTENLNGLFFVLGDNLKNRLNHQNANQIKQLYGTNIVASHGKTHVSHQGYKDWQQSIDYTDQLIKTIFTQKNNLMVSFRPPYGQRKLNAVDYLSKNKSKIILWNIDSQDWSNEINAQEVADRQVTLMLLWRKGILLFHDVHSKAQTAVPFIHQYFSKANLTWLNPNQI